MTTCFIFRYSGAIDWAKQQDFKIDAKKNRSPEIIRCAERRWRKPDKQALAIYKQTLTHE